MLNKQYETTMADYPEVFYQTIFGAMMNIVKKKNVTKITAIDIDTEIQQYEGALGVWNDNNGWEYINESIEITSNMVSNVGKYRDDVRKYSIIRHAVQDLKIDISFLYNEEDSDIDYKFNQMTSADVLNQIKEKFNSFKNTWQDNFTDAHSFTLKDNVKNLLDSYKEQVDVWGYPYQSGYLTTLTRGIRSKKYNIISSISGGGKSRTAIANAVNIACDKIYDWGKRKWSNTGDCEPVLYISTELEESEIQTCVISHISGIPQNRLVKWDNITKEEEQILNDTVKMMEHCMFYGEYLPDFNIDTIEETIEHYVITKGIKYCFFDYINDSPSLYAYYQKLTKTRLRTDQILYSLSEKLKLMANKYDIHLATSTQLNDGYKDSNNKDASALKGSKSIIDKADVGILALPVTSSDLEKLKTILESRGSFGNNIPNMAYYIYKNRDGERNKVIVWTKLNLGTMREVDCFVTDYDYKLITDIEQTRMFGTDVVTDVGDVGLLVDEGVEYDGKDIATKLSN